MGKTRIRVGIPGFRSSQLYAGTLGFGLTWMLNRRIAFALNSSPPRSPAQDTTPSEGADAASRANRVGNTLAPPIFVVGDVASRPPAMNCVLHAM